MSVESALELRLTFVSDWHIGSGGGRHGIFDSLVARDGDGFPYVPASTLRGMMRDACEHAARALGPAQGWPEFCAALFGDEPARWSSGDALAIQALPPRQGRIAVSAARLSPTLRARIAALDLPEAERFRQAMTFARPGIAIARETGQAKEDMLRFDEVARGGLVLQAECALDVPEDIREVALAFLQAGAFLLDRIGGNRRRGPGRVEVALKGKEVDDGVWASRVLREQTGAPGLDESTSEAASSRLARTVATSGQGDEDFVDIPFRVDLLAPTLVGGRVEANVVTGADHLPGSSLLPAIRRRLEEAGIGTASDLVASGLLRVSPALPERGGTRALPVPATWRVVKTGQDDTGKEILDILSVLYRNGDAKTQGESDQLKRVSGGFCVIAGAEVYAVRPRMELATHSTIDDEFQRPTARVGGVYVYEALASGQTFLGVLSVSASSVAAWPENWRDEAGGSIRLGRARGAGYGAARVSFGGAEEAKQLECPAGPASIDILFESDALLSGSDLLPGVDEAGVSSALRDALGPDASASLTSIRCALRPAVTRSWSAAWGLPRPDLLGIGAGSLARLRFSACPPAEVLDALRRKGIGLRRAEGFGRLHVFSPVEETAAEDQAGPRPTGYRLGGTGAATHVAAAVGKALDGEDAELACRLEDAACRTLVFEAIERLLVDPVRFKGLMGFEAGASIPTMSQLGAFRDALTASLDEKPEAFRRRLSAFVEKRRTHKKSQERWGAGSLERLGALFAEQPDKRVCTHLRIGEEDDCNLPTLVGQPAAVEARNEIWALRHLLMAAIQFHKRALEANASSTDIASSESVVASAGGR